jgi:hypothetical protein
MNSNNSWNRIAMSRDSESSKFEHDSVRMLAQILKVCIHLPLALLQ